MNISFDNNKLKKYANNDSQAVKKLGSRRAELYTTSWWPSRFWNPRRCSIFTWQLSRTNW